MTFVKTLQSRWRSWRKKTAIAPDLTASYYQQKHERDAHYQANNWMLDEIDFLQQQGAEVVAEVGCGNGRFLDLAASRFRELHGYDWALSPLMAATLKRRSNVRFSQLDVTREPISERADLAITSDVLEHFPPDTLPFALANIDRVSPRVFHKIACYHTPIHLSVLAPHEWLARLQELDPAYAILDVQSRTPGKPVVRIGKNLCHAQARAAVTSGSAAYRP